MAMSNGLAGMLGGGLMQYDPRTDQYYYEQLEQRRLMEKMAAMQNAASGLCSNEKQPIKPVQAVKPTEPQPNPVLLLTGDDE